MWRRQRPGRSDRTAVPSRGASNDVTKAIAASISCAGGSIGLTGRHGDVPSVDDQFVERDETDDLSGHLDTPGNGGPLPGLRVLPCVGQRDAGPARAARASRARGSCRWAAAVVTYGPPTPCGRRQRTSRRTLRGGRSGHQRHASGHGVGRAELIVGDRRDHPDRSLGGRMDVDHDRAGGCREPDSPHLDGSTSSSRATARDPSGCLRCR